MRDAHKTIGTMLDKQKVVYISSLDQDGFPNTKAMLAPRERQGISTIYFSTNTSSLRVSQFIQNPKACIYFSDVRFFRGAMLLCTVEVLTDSATKERIWREGDTMYYPLGVTDPDYCVLKCTVLRGRYYSNFKSEDFTVEEERTKEYAP